VREETGPYLKEKWEALTDHPLVGQASIKGLMGSIAMTPHKESRAEFKVGAGPIGLYCRTRCFENGLVMRHVGNRMIIAPPLIIKKDEIDTLIDRAVKSLDQTYAWAKSEGHMNT
jgi:putrescine aminotransferase